MNQQTLFEKHTLLEPTDPRVEKPDTPRLRGQNHQILQQLQIGPQTNKQLAAISLKYTSRISDLRKHGYAIECEKLGGGLTKYTLKGRK